MWHSVLLSFAHLARKLGLVLKHTQPNQLAWQRENFPTKLSFRLKAYTASDAE